ncbi:C6 zinc finger protein [Colletotrichum higginsianum IMI 349063]|uniref:C6 zinc finger protein n=1 Tax=Colletotrichum higginsianum (strain IMI 349063) TaxID=759273 RepID=A0A1B7Y0U5_COLHI|nr:C6 zinc finger protein [Colletotrichum higginsianum IMI 349063]OBR05627.1 C6 zinc finger protein [Colletotrichum higginsianum IMI 349063]
MKRRAEDPSDQASTKRPRQPQVACDSCRRKKLKCDRADPCSSCAMRGLVCMGQPSPRGPVLSQTSFVPPLLSDAGDPDSILGRLRKLEQAVFGGSTTTGSSSADHQPPIDPDPETRRDDRRSSQTRRRKSGSPPSHRPSPDNDEWQQTARFLDSTYTRNGLNISLPNDKIDYHITTLSQLPRTPTTRTTPGHTPLSETGTRFSAWLMTRDEALALLRAFVENPFHLLPIIRLPAAHAVVDAFYAALARNRDPNPAHAALILGIAASSAFFDLDGGSGAPPFASAEDATRTALVWLRSALQLLDNFSRGASGAGCLEEVQARCVLANLVYNMEGCSARFRFLHGCSLAAAREIGLHVVDGASSKQNPTADDAATREIKRRVWWHIAATDWMLGLMGGPTDGTYNVQPRHTNVNLPRNVNDDETSLADEALTLSLSIPTSLTCFLKRLQLAGIARAIIDARGPGAPDADITDYDKILGLDRLFRDALADFPPFLRPDGPIPPTAPRQFALQRDVILLAFHSRRARLHRPSLLHDSQDAQYRLSRDICLQSARTALSVATSILRAASRGGEPGAAGSERAMGCRMGCVIGHMFMACTILALNSGSDAGRAGPRDDGSDATTETHAEVARACRDLASVGKESAVARTLVRNLAGVLRRYRVQGVEDVDSETCRTNSPGGGGDRPSEIGEENMACGRGTGGDISGYDIGYSDTLGDGDDLGLDGLWKDILVDTTTSGWDQLFAGLDTYCGPT